MNSDTAGSLVTMALVAVTVAIVLLWMTTAAPAIAETPSVCLTKKQARALWPKKHIWWYSAKHCWSNRRHGPPTGIKYDLIRENHAQSLPAGNPPKDEAGKGDRAAMNASQPKRGTVRIIPIVKQAEWQNDFEDYCCWPSMEDALDADRERERAFRLLAEKLRNKTFSPPVK